MYTYQLLEPFIGETSSTSVRRLSDGACIPFSTENTDYQNFKYQINHDEAELQNVDGTLMSSAEAKAYVATLP